MTPDVHCHCGETAQSKPSQANMHTVSETKGSHLYTACEDLVFISIAYLALINGFTLHRIPG